MTALLVAMALLGLVVGSFLTVVVVRVPRGESLVAPRSRCPSCETGVRPRDNVPVLGWVLLRGRCRHCGAPLGSRYPLVEAGTAVLFVALTLRLGPSWQLPAFLYLAAVGVALAFIDLDVHRLPDPIVLPSYAVGALLLALPAAVEGDWGAYLRAWLGGGALFGFYFVLAVVQPEGMGFGDVKLSGVLGLHLAWLGWGELLVGGFLGFLLGGVYGLLLVLTRRATRRSAIPFGPFMLLGTLLAVLAGDDWLTRHLLALPT